MGVGWGLAEAGQVTGYGIRQGKPSGIAELEDGEGGEALGHGGDAESGIGPDGQLFPDVGGAVGEGMNELPVDNDAVDEAGDMIGGGVGAIEGVELGRQGEDAALAIRIGEAGWIDLGLE